MTRRIGVVVSTTLAAGLAALTVALPSAASAGIASTGPTPHEGNATTCAQAGLSGDIIVGDFKPPQGQKTVTINPADVAGYDVTGTVVMGGNNYNVYPPSMLTDLRAPDNHGGQQPDLSHWFVCGTKKDSSTTTKPPGNPPSSSSIPSSSPSSSSSSSAPGGGATTTTSPAAQGSVVNSTALADTGFSAAAPLVGAGALIVLGGGLLLGLRRTRRRG